MMLFPIVLVSWSTYLQADLPPARFHFTFDLYLKNMSKETKGLNRGECFTK